VVDALFASTTMGVALLDRDLRYIRVNDALAAVNLVPAADHIGRTSAELIPWRTPPVTDFQRHVLETGEPVLDVAVTDPAEDTHEARDRIFHASYFPVRGKDESGGSAVVGVLVIVVEATALVEAEEVARHRDELFR